jgi:SAM-dependent methyltransferase
VAANYVAKPGAVSPVTLRETLPYHGKVDLEVRPVAIAAIVLALVTPGGASGTSSQPPARTPDIYYTPTRHAVADAMLQLAGVTRTDVVYDLGSGDGRIVIIAAQKYGARGLGVEIDPALVSRARQNAADAGVTGLVTFVEGDLFTTDLSSATVVTLYLSGSVNRLLEPKLKRELRPGARVVSHQFPMPGWTPDATIRPDGIDVFLWRMR